MPSTRRRYGAAAGVCADNELPRSRRAHRHAKITRGYNLPAKWVIHTVGPIVYGSVPTEEDCRLLADCYRNCLAVAAGKGLNSIAFCCISTGEFHFPQAKAAEIAVATVRDYLSGHESSSISTVVFNVFKDEDLDLYKKLLGY